MQTTLKYMTVTKRERKTSTREQNWERKKEKQSTMTPSLPLSCVSYSARHPLSFLSLPCDVMVLQENPVSYQVSQEYASECVLMVVFKLPTALYIVRNRTSHSLMLWFFCLSANTDTHSKKKKKTEKGNDGVWVSVSVSLVTVISFLSAAVDLPFMCFYGFSCGTKQARDSVVFFISFLNEWIYVIVLACESKKKRKRRREEQTVNLWQ